MNSASAMAMEEAANLATEFIYSLDNLPNEIRHMCEEIKFLDSKAYDIQAAVEAECQRYVDLSRQPSGIPPNYKAPNQQQIAHAYDVVHQLNTDKFILSQQIVTLIMRTRSRLDIDISKVRKLQGEPPLHEPTTRSSSSQNGNGNVGFGLNSNAANEISESLRSVMTANAVSSADDARSSPAAVSVPTAISSSGGATKKRRVAATPSIKLPPARSISPIPPPKTAQHPQRASRLSRQVHPPPPPEPVLPEPEEEPEDLEGEEEDGDDDKPYCFCQKKSFGDMIACDGTNCPYEWFHLSCVGLKSNQLNEDTLWYCDVCKTKMAGQTNGRRRRK